LNDDFNALIGLPEEEVKVFLSKKYPTCELEVNYTYSPFLRNEDNKEQLLKKVIRIQNNDGVLDILIAYFAQPSY